MDSNKGALEDDGNYLVPLDQRDMCANGSPRILLTGYIGDHVLPMAGGSLAI